MAGGLKAVEPEATAPQDDTTKTLTIRGKTYVMRELTGGEYYDEQKIVQDEDGNIDIALLAKLITLKGVTCDGQALDPEAWNNEPFPVVNRVQLEMRQMHFIAAETDQERADRLKAEAAQRRKGNAPN